MSLVFRSFRAYGPIFDGDDFDRSNVKHILTLPVKLATFPVAAALVALDDYKWKKRMQKREEWLTGLIPKPLPEKRSRSLTLPLIPSPQATLGDRILHRAKGQVTKRQSRSKFFMLSPELRQMIYKEVFGHKVVHFLLLLPNNRIAPVICSAGGRGADVRAHDASSRRTVHRNNYILTVNERVVTAVQSDQVLSL